MTGSAVVRRDLPRVSDPHKDAPERIGTGCHYAAQRRQFASTRWPTDIQIMRYPTTTSIWRQTVPVDDDLTPDAQGEPGPAKLIPISELQDEEQWHEEMERAKERAQAMHRRKKELQARHWETWAGVKQAVDSTDPEGLLRMGCSDDEYDDVVVDLTGMVLGNADVTMQALMAWFMDRYGSEAYPDAVADLLGAVAAIQARISTTR